MAGGVRAVAAFEHEGTARRLMHLLKYQGCGNIVEVAAALLAPRLPAVPVVPVPRVLTRRLRYGVDPSALLARAVARRLGTGVARILTAPVHAPRRAGGDHRGPVPRFRLKSIPPEKVVVIDDVITTGATLETVIRLLGADRVVAVAAVNTVSGVSSLMHL